MTDTLTKAVSTNGKFRAYVVNATQTVQEAQQRHDTWRNSSAALGKTLIGSMLVAKTTLKEDEELTTRNQDNEPVAAIEVDTNAKGNVKGYITNPHINKKAKEDSQN